MSIKSKTFTSTFREKLEPTFSGILFVASAVVYVGGTLAMLLSHITVA